jgi:hypothetical protein
MCRVSFPMTLNRRLLLGGSLNLLRTLRTGNLLELPNLWIAIAVNVGEDARIATQKIFSLRQHYGDSIAFLLFVFPGDFTNACLQRIRVNSAILPLANQTHAQRKQNLSGGPYIRLWRIGAEWNESDYYRVRRNEYITFNIGTGADQVNYTLEVNCLIDSFA